MQAGTGCGSFMKSESKIVSSAMMFEASYASECEYVIATLCGQVQPCSAHRPDIVLYRYRDRAGPSRGRRINGSIA